MADTDKLNNDNETNGFLKTTFLKFIDTFGEVVKELRELKERLTTRECLLPKAEEQADKCKECINAKLSKWLNMLIIVLIILAIGKEIAWPVLSKLLLGGG